MESESESSSNPSSCEEADRFLDAPEEFFYDCFSSRCDSYASPTSNLRRRRLASERKPYSPAVETPPSSSSTKMGSFGKRSTVETKDELALEEESGTTEKDVDVIDSVNDPIVSFQEKDDDFEVIESCGDTDVTDSGRDRVDPFRAGSNPMSGEDYAEPGPPSTDWSLLGLVVRSIRFQVSLMIRFITFPPWLVSSCLAFVCDPYRTVRRVRRYLLSRIVELYDIELEDHKPMLQVVKRLALGFFCAVYVAIVLFALLASAFMISGFVITHLAHKPLVIKQSLNFDYTKNSPEAYVPITSCAGGIDFDSSCKESIATGEIGGLKVGPPNHRTEIIVSMTLPESDYNRNLGMFQVRVDLLSASGKMLASSRRPCMVRYRSGPIRLVQTFLKIAPLVTGYVSEIQTLNLKLKEFGKEDIVPAACLKVVIEQRAEFRPGAGVPEIYDASLFLESGLPFFKRIIWNWRRTLFVWIGMGLFMIELLFVLVFCSPLIIPRTQQRDTTPSINSNSNRNGQMGSR